MDKELDEVLMRFKSKLIGFGITTPLMLMLFRDDLDWMVMIISFTIFNLAKSFIELEYKNFVIWLVAGAIVLLLAAILAGEQLGNTVLMIGYIFLGTVCLILGVVSYIKRINKIKNKQVK